jgi:hypothetical protein
VIPAAPPGVPCAPITVYVAGSGTYTYGVRIEEGATFCVTARGVVRRFVVTATGWDGWRCFRGHGGDAWAAACSRGGVVVRAYGPTRERNGWRIAAARAAMPVLQPAATPGLRLRYVRHVSGCVEASYGGAGGASLLVLEGRPRGCAGVARGKPLPPPHGPVRVYQPAGGGYLLVLRMSGVAISLRTSHVTLARLRAIAESLRAVDV